MKFNSKFVGKSLFGLRVVCVTIAALNLAVAVGAPNDGKKKASYVDPRSQDQKTQDDVYEARSAAESEADARRREADAARLEAEKKREAQLAEARKLERQIKRFSKAISAADRDKNEARAEEKGVAVQKAGGASKSDSGASDRALAEAAAADAARAAADAVRDKAFQKVDQMNALSGVAGAKVDRNAAAKDKAKKQRELDRALREHKARQQDGFQASITKWDAEHALDAANYEYETARQVAEEDQNAPNLKQREEKRDEALRKVDVAGQALVDAGGKEDASDDKLYDSRARRIKAIDQYGDANEKLQGADAQLNLSVAKARKDGALGRKEDARHVAGKVAPPAPAPQNADAHVKAHELDKAQADAHVKAYEQEKAQADAHVKAYNVDKAAKEFIANATPDGTGLEFQELPKGVQDAVRKQLKEQGDDGQREAGLTGEKQSDAHVNAYNVDKSAKEFIDSATPDGTGLQFQALPKGVQNEVRKQLKQRDDDGQLLAGLTGEKQADAHVNAYNVDKSAKEFIANATPDGTGLEFQALPKGVQAEVRKQLTAKGEKDSIPSLTGEKAAPAGKFPDHGADQVAADEAANVAAEEATRAATTSAGAAAAASAASRAKATDVKPAGATATTDKAATEKAAAAAPSDVQLDSHVEAYKKGLAERETNMTELDKQRKELDSKKSDGKKYFVKTFYLSAKRIKDSGTLKTGALVVRVEKPKTPKKGEEAEPGLSKSLASCVQSFIAEQKSDVNDYDHALYSQGRDLTRINAKGAHSNEGVKFQTQVHEQVSGVQINLGPASTPQVKGGLISMNLPAGSTCKDLAPVYALLKGTGEGKTLVASLGELSKANKPGETPAGAAETTGGDTKTPGTGRTPGGAGAGGTGSAGSVCTPGDQGC